MRTRADRQTIRVYLFSVLLAVAAVGPVCGANGDEGRQILINPDFSLTPVESNPPGWFRAMMANLTTGLQAGVGQDEKGAFLYLEQTALQGRLLNNWAQRIEQPPIGASLRLETEIATEDAAGDGAVVLIMFFDSTGKILGGASSQGHYDLTGTRPFTRVSLEASVPQGCDLAIVRLGLSAAPGRLVVRYARLYLSGGQPSPVPAVTPDWQVGQAGLELLTNGDFEGLAVQDTPAGWFRAMIPDKAINHSAGLQQVTGHGNVAFIRQDGVTAALVNNWAQRLDTVPIGATLRLTAEVKTQDMPENTGVVMIQCWDKDGRLLAAATSQSSQPLGGTQDWITVTMDIVVPPQTDAIIVRCGLSQSGTIWFDNVSLKIISPAVSEPGAEATGESSENLGLARTLSEELEQYCRERLGASVRTRKEVIVQPDGKVQIVLLLDFSRR